MEYIVNKDGTIEKEANGYQITINTKENKINYAIGGRVFKTLNYFQAGYSLPNGDFDEMEFIIKIQAKDHMVDVVTVTKKIDSEIDLTNIVEAACKYAEQL